ncbi:MAG: ABC transporter permease [Clostridia bacterium]|nr:ABC transporter permease [Clostridia bacterium]
MKNRNASGAVRTSFFKRAGTRSVIASLLCILGGLLVGFIVLAALAAFAEDIPFSDAITGILTVLEGPFSGGSGNILFQLGNMLFSSTPLILTGLSVALAFKTGLFNIGAPGQYLMGAMGALLISLSIPTTSVPAWLVWTLAFLGGTALGVLWGAIPGFFKARFNVNEVIVCIMTNWIAANVVSWVFKATDKLFINYAETKMNFIRKTATNGVSTWTLGLDKLFGGSYMDVSIFIAIIIAIVLYIVLNKTTFGYELKACGFNRSASKYAGMNEKRNIILSMAIAGGLAAAGAALWCLNGAQDFKWDTYLSLPADGFNGIPAALLASNNPLGVIFSAIFLKYIGVGGSNLAAQTSFNEYVSPLIVAVIIYFAGFSKLIKELLGRRKREKNIDVRFAPAHDPEQVRRETAEDRPDGENAPGAPPEPDETPTDTDEAPPEPDDRQSGQDETQTESRSAKGGENA